ncbi:arginine metabolism regulation protein I [Monosporozyma servazzii]
MAAVTKKRKAESNSRRSASPKKKQSANVSVENASDKDASDKDSPDTYKAAEIVEDLPGEGEGEEEDDDDEEEVDEEELEEDDIEASEEIEGEDDGIDDDFVDEIEMIAEPKDVRRKIPIKYIDNRTRRQVTFAKRRHGIMKKAYELSVLTGANILLIILGQSGLVYTFSTPKLEPIVREKTGKDLIRACLNDP